MNTCRTTLLALSLCCLAALAHAAPPKVAIVFSDYGGGKQQTEFNKALEELGWNDSTLFNNRDAAKLTERLDAFDLVLATTLANYENTQDFTPYRDAWRRWLDQGGGMLVLDANYESVLGKWLNTLFPEAPLEHALCAPHIRKDIMLDTVSFTDGPTLLRIPEDITGNFEKLNLNWGHIESWGEGWEVLARCYDRKARILLRHEGRGSVLALTYSTLRRVHRQHVVPGMLANFWAHVQSQRHGLALREFALSRKAPGSQALTAAWTGIENLDDPRVTVTVVDDTGQWTTNGVPEEGAVRLPCRIDSRGRVTVTLTLQSGDTEIMEIPLRFTIPTPAALTIADPHAFPSRPYVDVDYAFAPDADTPLTEYAASFRIDGAEIVRMAPPSPAGTLRLPTAGLEQGARELSVTLIGGGNLQQNAGTAVATLHVNGERRFRHRTSDGTMLLNGKPMLPIGFYNVTMTMDSFEKGLDSIAMAKRLGADIWLGTSASAPDWQRVQQNGWAWRQLDDNWRRVLETAAEQDLLLVPAYIVPGQISEIFKGHPNVVAYYLADEPGVHGQEPANLWSKRDGMMQADPALPTVMCLAWPHMYHVYAKNCGILANDPYPVTVKPQPMIKVYDQLLDLRVNYAEKDDRATWAVLQGFGRPPEEGNWLLPDREAMRCMTWQALLAGSKGILYYALNEGHFVIEDHPEFQEIMKDVIAEVRTAEPALLQGQPSVDDSCRPVLVGTWPDSDRKLGVIVNASRETQTLDIPLPLSFPSDAALPQGIRIEDGRLAGVLRPNQTVVLP
jgi:hypothetical protein